MNPSAIVGWGWIELRPDYSVYEGRGLIGALQYRGHLFLASFVFPSFIAGDPVAIAHFIPSARTCLAEALAGMMRGVCGARSEELN